MSEGQLDESKDGIILQTSIEDTSPFPGAVRYACAVAIDSGSVLIFGGYDNMNQGTRKATDKVWFYNASINQYIEMKPLPYPVHEASAALTPDRRVAIVGGNPASNKLIIYTPFTKKEDHEIQELGYTVSYGASIVFDHRGNLHIFGGRENKQQHLMIKWAKHKQDRNVINLGNAPMRCYVSGVCCDKVKRKVYIMGSYEDTKDALWIYDVDNQTWKNGQNMPLKRGGFGCHFICHKYVIVIGADYGQKDSDKILLYNVETNEWSISDTNLKQTIGFHASALLTDRCEIHGFSGSHNGEKNVDTHFVVKY